MGLTITSSQPELTPTTPNANFVLRLDKTKPELASYLHADTGLPTKSTFIQALNNANFITWPGLTTNIISKQLPLSLTTLKGHLKQEQ